MDLNSLLTYAREHNASDLHLACGYPPIVRIGGVMQKLNVSQLTTEDIEKIFFSIANEQQAEIFKQDLELDFAIESDKFRYRSNIYSTINGPSIAIRVISDKIKNLQELMVPAVVERFTKIKKGLVVVTGATGSGKSTTLAAMIEHINTQYSKHIITIEDPIEYKFTSNKCLINQREVGANTHSFAKALKSALRENPDIIMIGELRDLETIQLALTAAETGHLVFGTLHTSSAAKTIDRIVDVFPTNDKPMIRTMLASSLEGIISQALLPKPNGNERVAAYEVLIANSAIRNLIRENKLYQVSSLMQIGSKQGMVLMDQSINALYSKGMISEEVAKDYAAQLNNKEEQPKTSENLASPFTYQDNEF